MMDRTSFSGDWVHEAERHVEGFLETIQAQYAIPSEGNWIIAGYAQYNLLEHFREGNPFHLYVAIALHRYLERIKEGE